MEVVQPILSTSVSTVKQEMMLHFHKACASHVSQPAGSNILTESHNSSVKANLKQLDSSRDSSAFTICFV